MPDAVPWLALSDVVPDVVPFELVLLLSAVPAPDALPPVWSPVLGCEPSDAWLESVVPDCVPLLAVEESAFCDWSWVFEGESADVELSCGSSCWFCDWPELSDSLSVVRDERIGSGRAPKPLPAVVMRMAPAQTMTATIAMATEKMMTFFCVWLRSAAALARKLLGATRAVVARPAT